MEVQFEQNGVWIRCSSQLLHRTMRSENCRMGFNYLPGPNGEMFVLDYDVGALVQFPVAPFPPDIDIVTLEVQVETPTHRVSKANVNLLTQFNLFNTNPKRIYQGQTDDGPCRIWVVGASESDHLIQAASGGSS